MKSVRRSCPDARPMSGALSARTVCLALGLMLKFRLVLPLINYPKHLFERKHYMKTNIELEWEQVDAIVVAQLKVLLECLENDLARVQEQHKGFVFKDTPEDDIKAIKKHIKSFKRVLRYFGEEL
jgi:hypothetical protein